MRRKSSARATCSRRTCSAGSQVLGGFGGVADTLNLYNHYVKNPGYLGDDLARHRAVTAASVKTFVQTSLKPSARVVVFGVPGDPDLGPQVPTPPAPKVAPGTGAEAVNAEEAWRKDQPKPAAQRPITLPTPQSFQLPNGLTVLHYERPGMPVVAASLVIKNGGDSNPNGSRGPRELHRRDARPGDGVARRAHHRRRRRASWRVAVDLVRQGRVVRDGAVAPEELRRGARSAGRRRAPSELSRTRRSIASGRAGWAS